MKHLFTVIATYGVWRLSTLGIFAPIGQQVLMIEMGVTLK